MACALLACALLHAQTTAELATHDSTPTFSSGVNLVQAPVVVRDAKGHAIGTLRKEDFQLFDKGKLQIISKFSIETPGSPLIVRDTTIETDATGKTAEGNSPAAPAATPIATRFVAWLFDDVHISPSDLMQARQAAERRLAEPLEPGTRAGIFTTSGRTTLDFTDDTGMLRQALLSTQPSPTIVGGGIRECPDIGFFQADLRQAMQQIEPIVRGYADRALTVNDRDTRLALSVLRNMVQRMAVLPGSRTIVLASSGFFLTNEHRPDENDLMDRAIRANVTISSLDARGLYVVVPGGDAGTPVAAPGTFAPGASGGGSIKAQYAIAGASAVADVMGELADATGGTFFHNNKDLAEGFKRIAAQPEFVCVLGFSPQDLKLDGSFHALKVTFTKNPSGYQLQARRGYFVRQHATDPAEQAKQDIEEAFFSRDGNYVTASQKTIDISLTDRRLETISASGVTVKSTLDVPSGSYVVRLIVRDSEGQAMSARNGVVEIP